MGRERYFSQLGYVELGDSFFNWPRQAVLNRWSGDDRSFGVIAWQGITHAPGRGGYPRATKPLPPEQLAEAGSYRDTQFVRDAVTRLATGVTTAGAAAVVFRTPADWSPSATNRDRLQRFFGDIATAELFGDCVRVWQPEGLWELEETARLCTKMDVVMACDPLANDPLAPPYEFFVGLAEAFDGVGYFRRQGLGQSRPLTEYQRELLADLVDGYERAWLVFDSPSKYRDARAVAKDLETRAPA